MNQKAKEEWEKKQAEAEKIRKLNEVSALLFVFFKEVNALQMQSSVDNVIECSEFSLRVKMGLMEIRRKMMAVANRLRYVAFFSFLTLGLRTVLIFILLKEKKRKEIFCVCNFK